MAKELSGPSWVERFPDRVTTAAMTEPFRSNCEAFIAALQAAGADVTVVSTLRPMERAYLMNSAWRIGRKLAAPAQIGSLPGVDIEWVHRTTWGAVDLQASIAAAKAMIAAFGLGAYEARKSNHTLGLAIDMAITWSDTLRIANPKGATAEISSSPRTGMNKDLWEIGRRYSVIKHKTDPLHWSIDGR